MSKKEFTLKNIKEVKKIEILIDGEVVLAERGRVAYSTYSNGHKIVSMILDFKIEQ